MKLEIKKKIWISKYLENILIISLHTSLQLRDHAKQSAINALKTSSKRVIQKAAEATRDLIGNKIANIVTKVSKNSQQNNSETVINGVW